MTPEVLRYTLATLAYRASKALRGAPSGFTDFRAFPSTRSPGEILAHLGDLMDWGLACSAGKPSFSESAPLPWEEEIARFFASLTAWDAYLASGAALEYSAERLFQGPIADALNHVGQINLLRRMAGSPVRGESYNRAPIAIGQTQFEQPATDPKFEFD